MSYNSDHSSGLAKINDLLLELKEREQLIIERIEKEKHLIKEKEKAFLAQENVLKEEKEQDLKRYKNERLIEIKKEIEDILTKERKAYESNLIALEKKYLDEEQLIRIAKEFFLKMEE